MNHATRFVEVLRVLLKKRIGRRFFFEEAPQLPQEVYQLDDIAMRERLVFVMSHLFARVALKLAVLTSKQTGILTISRRGIHRLPW